HAEPAFSRFVLCANNVAGSRNFQLEAARDNSHRSSGAGDCCRVLDKPRASPQAKSLRARHIFQNPGFCSKSFLTQSMAISAVAIPHCEWTVLRPGLANLLWGGLAGLGFAGAALCVGSAVGCRV